MSLPRLGLLGSAAVAFPTALAFWHFGDGFPRVLEVLLVRPGSPTPPTLSHPLYAAVFAILYVVSLALACGAVLAISHERALDLHGRLTLVLAGMIMAVGGAGIAWAMQNPISVLSIIAMSGVQIKPAEIQTAVSEISPRMQLGLTALCLPPISLFLCGLIGCGSPGGGSDRPPLPWLYPLSVAVVSLLLVVVFAVAIPAAICLPEFFTANEPFKASDIAAVIQRLLSIGRVSGVLFVIFGLVIANLATMPRSDFVSMPARN